MNFNKNDFRGVSGGDEIISILTQMGSSQNPVELVNPLMQALRESASSQAYSACFKYLVEISSQSRSLDFIAFISDFKTLLLRTDLNAMSVEQLREYVIALSDVTSAHGFFVKAEDVPNWSDDFKSYFMLTMTKLHSLSSDTVAFLFNGAFDKAFHTKCCHCGNDLHSYHIDGEDTKHITPANFSELPPAGIVPDVTPLLFYPAYQTIGEKQLSMVMPYLYGTYSCTACEGVNPVMAAIMNWIRANGPIFSPSEEYIDKLFEVVNKWDHNQANWADKLWYATKYYASQCVALYGKGSLKAQKELVRSAVRVASLWGNDFPTQVADSAIAYLKDSAESDLLKADLHFWIGYAISYGWDLPREEYQRAISHYRAAEELYIAIYGEDNENVTKCRNNIAQTAAEMPGGDMKQMIEQYERLKSNPKATQSEIALAEHHLAGQYEERGEYAKAIEMEQSTLNEYIEEYGADSDMVADHKERIAELYDKMGSSEEALKILEESAEVHIREMGREYMLPPLFRNMIHKGKRLFNLNQDPEKFAVRVRSVSGVYDKLGDIYFSMHNAKKAIGKYEKSLELFTWVSVPVGIEMVSMHFKIGVTYYCVDNNEVAIKHLNEALKHLHWTITESPYPNERERAQSFQPILVSKVSEVLSCAANLRSGEMEELYQIYKID